MPISMEVVDDKYTVLHCEGEIHADDFMKANERLYSEGSGSASRFQIVDLIDVTMTDVSAEELRRIAGQDKQAVKTRGRVAIAVVASKDLAFGLSRVWQAYAENPQVVTQIFRDRPSAREWILRTREKIA